MWCSTVSSHLPLMAIEGMRERTVKIGSAGKIFSLTGWKVGFVCAAPAILRVLAKAHQFITFTTPPNLQAAVAYGLAKDDSYFAGMRAGYQRSRDRFAAGLAARGFSVLPSAGTYFLNIDLAPLGCDDDVAFCRDLVERHGVAAIPVSAFYAEAPIRTVARFCFAKRDATLDAALDRLGRRRRASASDAGRLVCRRRPVGRRRPGRATPRPSRRRRRRRPRSSACSRRPPCSISTRCRSSSGERLSGRLRRLRGRARPRREMARGPL